VKRILGKEESKDLEKEDKKVEIKLGKEENKEPE
jgi:hypothetical protein